MLTVQNKITGNSILRMEQIMLTSKDGPTNYAMTFGWNQKGSYTLKERNGQNIPLSNMTKIRATLIAVQIATISNGREWTATGLRTSCKKLYSNL